MYEHTYSMTQVSVCHLVPQNDCKLISGFGYLQDASVDKHVAILQRKLDVLSSV